MSINAYFSEHNNSVVDDTRTMGLNMWCGPRCGGCGPLAGGVPLLEPELFDEPDDFGVGGRGLQLPFLIITYQSAILINYFDIL